MGTIAKKLLTTGRGFENRRVSFGFEIFVVA
jgi:hypothetical protein